MKRLLSRLPHPASTTTCRLSGGAASSPPSASVTASTPCRLLSSAPPKPPSSSSSSSASSSSPSSSSRSSVNPEELEKFSKYGQGWWDYEKHRGISGAGPLHSMNPVRVGFIDTRSGGIHGRRVLDVGCGGGLLSEALARLGAEVTGIDPSAENIAVAKQHAAIDPRTASISYRQLTAEQLRATGETFDVVCSSEVIEHVEDPESFVGNLAGLIKEDGGSLIITTINRTAKSYLIAILGAEYITGIIPRGTHTWNKFLQPQEVAHMIRKQGMEVEEVSGMRYNPLNNTWKLDKDDTDVNYILYAQKKKKKKKN